MGAACAGNLELLKWTLCSGCHWSNLASANAAKNGHLEVLKWSSLICRYAAKNGHLQVLKWAVENGHYFDETLF